MDVGQGPMTSAYVKLWGSIIGAVSLEDGARYASFQYDGDFAKRGVEVSPITMPLAQHVYTFPALALPTFHGLPGLLADSLPDKFGNALIDRWLARQGRTPDSFNAVERLCYTGERGMGALEFEPAVALPPAASKRIDVEALVAMASAVLAERTQLSTSLTGADDEDALQDILRVGTSAGGARAKAVIAWNPISNEVRSGQLAAPEGFEHWLLKFDGVTGNKDKEDDDLKRYGAIEYAYSEMAKAAGVTMSDCRLLEDRGRRHFMTKRFDRTGSNEKLHMQSLGALAHFDFNAAGAHAYEQAMQTMARLRLPKRAIEQQFRRMAFNIIARNQDDHVKNISLLMDDRGRWSLSPAYDVTYSYNPSGDWTSQHQMSMNGKRDAFSREDFQQCGRTVSLKRGRADRIVDEVRFAVCRWPTFADDARVHPRWRDDIHASLRLELPLE
jgi:serine/threonine-protein kinase HipA